jgi:hypothetical protein
MRQVRGRTLGHLEFGPWCDQSKSAANGVGADEFSLASPICTLGGRVVPSRWKIHHRAARTARRGWQVRLPYGRVEYRPLGPVST